MTARDDASDVASLLAAIEREPWAFDFFDVMRKLERWTGAPRWGRAYRPADEPLRLSQEASLEFPPSMLAGLHRGTPKPRLDVRFFGLFGPQGPLPTHMTEHVYEREHHRGDPVPARFLDIFQHRLITLFYRAWAQSQPVVQHDRPADDRYAAWLGSAIGLAPVLDQPPGDAVPAEAWLHQAGLLAMRSPHPEGLAKILRQHFGVGVAVQGNVVHWLPIERDERSRLGRGVLAPRVRDGVVRLGESAVIGTRLWSAQHKFRVRLGPLTLAQYESFCLPGSRAWRHLVPWVQRYAGPATRWDVQLRLARQQVPQPALGRHVRLGLTAWLGDRRRDRHARDRDDLRLPGRADAVRTSRAARTPQRLAGPTP